MSLLLEVLNQFKELNHVVIATTEEETPKLRPITLLKVKNRFYFATGTSSNKVRHLKKNPKVELLLQWKEEPNNGYIRVAGTARKEENNQTISELYSEYDFFSKLWKGPDDPTLIVYKISTEYFDYMKPGKWQSVKVEIE